MRVRRYLIALLFALLPATTARAETGHDAWLRYQPIANASVRASYLGLPTTVTVLGSDLVLDSAASELTRALQAMIGRTITRADGVPAAGGFVIGTTDAVRAALPALHVPALASDEGFWLRRVRDGRASFVVVAGGGPRGALYGVFSLLRRMSLLENLDGLDVTETPSAPLRWVNEWNNLDGSIERGYGGRSIFFDGGEVRQDLRLAGEYARLLASVGINAASINNVNANIKVISDPFLPSLARIAAAFRPWGVRLAVAVDFSSPKSLGGLDTFDPLDPRVASFWKTRVDAIYGAIPDLAGFVVKADSEGRLGPSAYGRSHADAANVIARALAPHHGVIFYRGFVYDHHMDWRNLKNDRARAAWDNFHQLDGRFDANVVLQIKHGPIDFQAREPVSPLFGALDATNQSIELQVTQEYTGQQRHVCFLIPMWKEVLDFDLEARGPGTPVKALVSGATFKRPLGGFVAVSNVGQMPNWLGHDLAMANLYGYGRLAWNPDLTSEQIAGEWTRQTFGHQPLAVETITSILLDSWPTYERYTGPLGAQTLTDIVGPHYGPAVEASERNGWGQWHRADEKGIGMNRTVASGTGFVGQYSPRVAARYESIETCPDELVLFMHHVPYTHVLHSGKSVIQHIYDTHYQGAAEAEAFATKWRRLEGIIDADRFRAVAQHLDYQAGHAIVWRDAINSWFLKTSGILDEKGRASHFPGRIEAEAMSLQGYAAVDVSPWETASGGKGVRCAGSAACTASTTFNGASGPQEIIVRYFDENDGASRFCVRVGGREIDAWTAADAFPTKEANGHSSTRRVIHDVHLAPGDVIVVEGVPDGGEPAVLDYIEIGHM